MLGDDVFVGDLEFLHGRPAPIWVFAQKAKTYLQDRVYVQLPYSEGLVASLRHFHYYKDLRVQKYSCFILLQNNIVLRANLQSTNVPVDFSASPRIFVRMLDRNNTVYAGIAKRVEKNLPRWIQ